MVSRAFVGLVGLSAGLALGLALEIGLTLSRLATENEQIRFIDTSMMRGKTNYERPGVTKEEVDAIKRVAYEFAVPEEFVYALRRGENGGRSLPTGAHFISPEIRKHFPPMSWQYAQGAKTWNKHINKTVLRDPYVRELTLRSFAKQWNPDPDKWVHNVSAQLDEARFNGLAVTEPPKKAVPLRAKAKAGAAKSRKHEVKK